jgi:hypothetical protein
LGLLGTKQSRATRKLPTLQGSNRQAPFIREIFDAAETTAQLLDELAHPLRCDRENIDFERKEQRKSVEAFCGHLESVLLRTQGDD